LFYKKIDNGKYRYYEKYYDESEGRWKQATVTLNSRTRQAQSEARTMLETKINFKLSKDKLLKKVNQKIKHLTVGEVYEEFLAFRKQELKDSTFYIQAEMLNGLLKSIFKKRIVAVSSQYFQNYFILNHNSLAYKKLQKTVLNLFFRYALKVGYIESNPLDKVELPKIRKTLEEIERKKAKFLSKEEMKQFMSFFGRTPREVRLNLLIEFMYLTGLRIGESLALIWENVDLKNQLITIKYTLDKHSASLKAFKLTSPKTNDSYRTISINKRCVEILKELKQLNTQINPLDKRFIFLNTTGGLIDPILLNYYLKAVGKRANLANKVVLKPRFAFEI
jgi:integrase